MAQNFPGPFEVEIEYVVNDLKHLQRLNCDVETPVVPGQPPSTYQVRTRQGVTIELDTAVSDYVTLALSFFSSTDASFTAFTLWQYAPQSFDRSFVTTGALGLNGTNPTPAVLAGQGTYTFRSSEGGRMRITWLEHSLQGFFVTEFADLGADAAAFMNYVLSPASWILARDTSYPIVGLRQLRGQNEAIFRKRFRP